MKAFLKEAFSRLAIVVSLLLTFPVVAMLVLLRGDEYVEEVLTDYLS